MKPKKSAMRSQQPAFFRVCLDDLVDKSHPLVQLASKIDWQYLESKLSEPFHEEKGAPAKPVRLMAGPQYLKHTFNLSDERLVERRVENPYWQYFCGSLFFEYGFPIHPTLERFQESYVHVCPSAGPPAVRKTDESDARHR